MGDIFDINLAQASTREFLRQGGTWSQIPRLWWYRWRGVIWLVEKGYPRDAQLRECRPEEIAPELAGEFKLACQPIQADFGSLQFLRSDAFAVERALAAVTVSADGLVQCQLTRVETDQVSFLSANFTSITANGEYFVTGNARNYWDPPAALRTRHFLHQPAVQLLAKHRRWLEHTGLGLFLRLSAAEALQRVQQMSRMLTESYIRRGLYVVRTAPLEVVEFTE